MDEDVAGYPEFHTEQFTVEVLSGIKKAQVPMTEDGYPDLSYMTYDCFHVSQKSNALCKCGEDRLNCTRTCSRDSHYRTFRYSVDYVVSVDSNLFVVRREYSVEQLDGTIWQQEYQLVSDDGEVPVSYCKQTVPNDA